jgi:hypothetical protein
MRLRNAVFSFLLLPGASALFAADQLDASIAKVRMGTLVIEAAPGAKVSVEQVRHEFWFGATLPTGVFTGRTSPDDIASLKRSSPATSTPPLLKAPSSGTRWSPREVRSTMP